MRIFVTGGTGFIGAHFIRLALEKGHDVIALRRPSSGCCIPLPNEPEWHESSLTDIPDELLASCDALFHFAAQGVSPQPTDWGTAFDVNVQQSLKLMVQANRLKLQHIVCCGSCFEYGLSGTRYDFIPVDAPLEPVGPYAASKAAFSLALGALARTSSSSWSLLRPFHLYGEGQDNSNFWPSLRKAALAGEDFAMTAGEQVRDYMPVEDAVIAFIECLAEPRLPNQLKIANIGSGLPTSIRVFAEKWWRHWNASGELKIKALPYRENEVMRFIPQLKLSQL